MKFRLIKDLVLNTGFEEEVILNKGEIIEDTNGEYFFAKLNKVYTKEDLLSKPDIFELLPEIKLEIKEVDQEDEDKIGNWRIQLDVKTSKRKLKEIEIFLRETISEML